MADGWIDRWAWMGGLVNDTWMGDEWINEDGWMGQWELMNEYVGRWMTGDGWWIGVGWVNGNEQMDEWVFICMYEWMQEWMLDGYQWLINDWWMDLRLWQRWWMDECRSIYVWINEKRRTRRSEDAWIHKRMMDILICGWMPKCVGGWVMNKGWMLRIHGWIDP